MQWIVAKIKNSTEKALTHPSCRWLEKITFLPKKA